MYSIAIRNIKVEVPENWQEITKRNLLWLAKRFPYPPTLGMELYFFFHALNLSKRPLLQLAIARNFILSKKLNRAWKNDAAIEFGEENFFEQQILQAISSCNNFNFLNESIEIPDCLIKSFSLRFKKYYGPQERLCNVTADEFKHAELFYNKFVEEKDEKYLFLLLATLWREKSKQYNPSDIRTPFNEFEIEKRAKKFQKLSYQLKIACMLNYLGMRNAWINEEIPKFVFDKKEDTSSEGNNWNILLMRLGESQVFGNYHLAKNTCIHDIVEHLADLKAREQNQHK